MKFGVYTPNFGPFGDPRRLAELAHTAEEAGWDGIFIWDHILWTQPQNDVTCDPWVALAAMAAVTTRITLGPLVTPIPRRHPWKLARETVTLDHLSGGRFVLGVGLGHDMFKEYSAFDEPTDPALHGEMLDEGLDVLTGLWSGKPFSYEGQHYRVHDAEFLPPPLQQPRIPIWVAGMWPNRKPFRRAARWDGVFPIGRDAPFTADDLRAIRDYIAEHRTSSEPMDYVVNGRLFGSPRAAKVLADFEEAGATWWLEPTFLGHEVPIERILSDIEGGPPIP